MGFLQWVTVFLSFSILASNVYGWSYSERKDPMGRGSIKTAYVSSTNQLTFDFPYGGPQRATLQLRIHPQYGQDVILSVERGQFLCRASDGCNVLVRFDDGAPDTYSAVGPSDHSTDVLFIQGYDTFVRALHKAKQVRIEAEFFRQGRRVMTFNVQRLKWKAPPEPRPYVAPKPSKPNDVAQMEACIAKGQAQGLKMDALSDFIHKCAEEAQPTETAEDDAPPPDASESYKRYFAARKAATGKCVSLGDDNLERTMCETKLSYCETNHGGHGERFEQCLAGS